jgi:hypothetical protein
VTGVGGTIAGRTWADGQTLWLRWVERNDSGDDHGLAIDDFSFTAHGAATVPDTLPFGFAAATFLGIVLLSRRVSRQTVTG